MWTADYWKAVAERAIKAFASSLAALLVADGTGLLDTAWTTDLSVAGMSAVVSVLLNVASAGVGPSGPSLVNESIDPGA